MTGRRGTAVAIALLLSAALAAAGCGLGPGKGLGDVTLTVTRDYGERPVAGPLTDEVTEADTVMRVLDRNADIATSYGGGFVQSIDGLAGDQRDGRYNDWLFYVNGVESGVGAADYPLHGGERIWWDYRDWTSALHIPAVVGSWPEPFADGYEGHRHPVEVDCLGGGEACTEVRRRLDAAIPAHRRGGGDAIRVLVGPWERVREDPAAAQIEDGPQTSGVFADFARKVPSLSSGGFVLRGFDEAGKPAIAFGPDAGLVAATRRYDAPPTWVVTGSTAAAARAAAGLLDAADLRDHYAVVVEGGREEALPLR